MQPITDPKKLWEKVLVEVELGTSKAVFVTWFKDTFIHKIEEGVVYISVPNAFAQEWIQSKFHKIVLKHLRDANENIRGLDYVIAKDPKKQTERAFTPAQFGELPLKEFYINKEDNLNPKYTFESFVVGPFNDNAYAAAQAIVEHPGSSYNPLFIYGNTGHGKTHLIQSIGNHIKSKLGKKVCYLTSEKFTLEYTNSILTKSVNSFKEKYRKYDVLILDDIQFISGKVGTQEELFHIFNTMLEENKQIVFSSDKHPNHISDIQDRFKSRLVAGMVVDIPAPDFESRIAIIRAKARLHNTPMSEETVQYIASVIEGNIREIEGVLNTILYQSQTKKRELTLNEIKNLTKDSIKPKKNVSVENVIKSIADFYHITPENIYEKTRKKEIVKPRQIAMYILREDFNISFPTIGQKLGGRDHTTVMHSCEKMKNDIKTDPTLAQEIQQIRGLL